MKIILKAKGTANITKEFDNKTELFDFVQRNVENSIYADDEKENRKIKILNGRPEYFSIYELVEMIDYKRIYEK